VRTAAEKEEQNIMITSIRNPSKSHLLGPSASPYTQAVRRAQDKELQPEVTEADLVASICRDSFYEFVKEFWDVVIPETPIWNWHIKYLCDELQKVAERVFLGKPKAYDLIINISPGTTKSTICSVMFPAWCWTRMPSARFICGSHAHDLALDLSRKSRSIIAEQVRNNEKPTYEQCFGLSLSEDQNTKGYFTNDKKGMRMCCTVGGKSPIGFHGHFLIIDDPIDPQAAVSTAELKTANEWMDNTLPSRKIDKNITPTILIMQRLHQNDPTGHWIRKRTKDVKVIKLPADSRKFEVQPAYLKKYYVDDLMDPVRIPRKFLQGALKRHGQYYVAGQFGQNPVPLGGGMFKVKRLKIEVTPPHPSEFKCRIRYWDKASTRGAGDYTVGTLMGLDKKGRIWVLDVIRGQWDSHERESIIKATAKRDGRKVYIGVEEEPGSGGKDSATSTARNLLGWRVLIDKPSKSDGSKEQRADPFSVQVNAYNVYLVKAGWNSDYIEELEYFPSSTYDDQVDSSAGAFNNLALKRRRVGAM
jgi:predicted phage terminase large subunit-like protein